MSNCQVLEKGEGPVTARNGRYGECQKNHVADIVIGVHVVDGCLEFMAGGVEGTDSALTCPACGCHRNFHKRMVDTEINLKCGFSSEDAWLAHLLAQCPSIKSLYDDDSDADPAADFAADDNDGDDYDI